MKTSELQDFFENQDFTVHLFKQDNKQCAEIETWTNGGVNMIFTLMPFSVQEFIECVVDFDVDEEIDIHRQDERYKNAFSIKESLEDFTDFKDRLNDVVKEFRKPIIGATSMAVMVDKTIHPEKYSN